MKRDFTIFGSGVIVALLFVAGVLAWQAANKPLAVIAQPPKELNGEALTEVPCRTVFVYRDKVREKLGVPEGAGQVLGSVRIAPDDHPHTVTPVIDDTGKTTIFDRRDPFPLFDTTSRYGLGFSPIVVRSENMKPTQSIDIMWRPVKIKAVDVQISGEYMLDGGWAARARLYYGLK